MITIRELSQIIGLLVSSFSAVEFGKLHYRNLEIGKTQALNENKGNFEAKVKLSLEMKIELQWWIDNIH